MAEVPSVGGFLERVIQVDHGRSIGDAVKRTGLAAWALAQADVAANLAWGIVALVEDADHFHVAIRQGTFVYWPSHGLGSLGDLGYVSQISAGVVGSKPTGGLLQAVAKVVDSSSVEMLDPNRVEDS